MQFLGKLVAIAAIGAFAAPSVAATQKTPRKKVETITCRDFVTLDNRFKPRAVSYVIGYNKAKHPEVADVDVSGIDRVVPMIVTSCTAKPNETLMQRIRALWNKL